MAPLVSVLMPVYKTALYLREAMDSILTQTFTDFELIVLDDCSPDNAEDVLSEYNDSRIVRYRGENNQGLANVLNIGIEMAQGKYIARMDSDDISLPDRLRVQVDYLECHPDIDLCSCGMQLFGDKNDVWIRESEPEKVKITAAFFPPFFMRQVCGGGLFLRVITYVSVRKWFRQKIMTCGQGPCLMVCAW